MSEDIKSTSPNNSSTDSISQGWQTVNNGQSTVQSFSSPSESKAESDSEGTTVEHIEDIATYTGDVDDEEAVISGPLAERLVSEAIITTPAVAAAVASEATIAEAGDADALQFWENEAASGYRGHAAGKRPSLSIGQYAEAGGRAEGEFGYRLRRIQELMGLYEVRENEDQDHEKDLKEDEYWTKYMANGSSPAVEPDSPGIEDSGAPARRQMYVLSRQNRLGPSRDASGDHGSGISVPMPSPPRQSRQSSVRDISSSDLGSDVSIPIPSPARQSRQSPARDNDASTSDLGSGVTIPLPSFIPSPIRQTSNTDAYGRALASFDSVCQSLDECVQIHSERKASLHASNTDADADADANNASGSNDNANPNANDNDNENANENDFPCDAARSPEPDQEYDADGESSDPLALDATIPIERANPSSPEPEADSGYEEGN